MTSDFTSIEKTYDKLDNQEYRKAMVIESMIKLEF